MEICERVLERSSTLRNDSNCTHGRRRCVTARYILLWSFHLQAELVCIIYVRLNAARKCIDLNFVPESKRNAMATVRAYFKKKLVLHTEELSLEGTMASAEREPMTGVWGGAPHRVQGRVPSQRVRGRRPWSLWHFYTQSAFPALFLWHFANFAA